MPLSANTIQSISSEIQSLLNEFEVKHKRPLRILHIGNIANNAYINAKIMREHGIEADVLCFDYYHIMGCPEWEDADFDAKDINHNYPDWRTINVGKFVRPNWFIQGPALSCLQYIIANNKKSKISRIFYRVVFNIGQQYVINVNNNSNERNFYRQSIYKFLKYCYRLKPNLGSLFKKSLFHIVFHVVRQAVINLNNNSNGHNVYRQSIYKFLKYCYRLKPNLGTLFKKSLRNIECKDKVDITALFPMNLDDIATYSKYNDIWKQVFEGYDIVQGYSSSGVYPLLAGYRAYTAYEHGTIRTTPFQDDMNGRICTSVYQNAAAVFVTNTDCLVAAKKLNLADAKVNPLPHAFDTNKAFKFYEETIKQTRMLSEPVTFFAPARHHWKEGGELWTKGNDVIINAIHHLKKQDLTFRVVFIEYGSEVDVSKNLIRELDLDAYVKWIKPVTKKSLWKLYIEATAIIDQFGVPAIGGVSFECMAMAKRLLTRIDHDVFKIFFGEVPPIYHASTSEELALQMINIIKDPNDALGVGAKTQEWIKKYHSSELILVKQLKAYKKILEDK